MKNIIIKIFSEIHRIINYTKFINVHPKNKLTSLKIKISDTSTLFVYKIKISLRPSVWHSRGAHQLLKCQIVSAQ